MSKELAKYKNYNQLSPEKKNEIDYKLFTDNNMIIRVGDYLIEHRYNYNPKKVVDIEYRHYSTSEEGEKTFKVYIIVERDNPTEAYPTETIEPQYLSHYYVWRGTLEDLKEQADNLIKYGLSEKDKNIKQESQENAVMSFDKNTFVSLKTDLIIKAQALQSKMEMARKMMEQKVSEMKEFIAPMLAEVRRMGVIIWTIELYLGIKEDIWHIQKGKEAPLEEPIRLLQERLYMDEEVGDPENRGLDINSIEKFYDWLLKFNDYFGYHNYKLLLPYEKCIRIMRVRRTERDNYGKDPWHNAFMKEANFQTLILIRNGENIYDIQTDMNFGEKLFPAQDELMKIREDILKDTENTLSRNGRRMDNEYREEIIGEKLKTVTDEYKRNLIIVQGLIDRTEVFGKLFGIVNLMSGSAINKGQIEFIYDADVTNIISSGNETFIEKLKDTFSNIGRGSRVLYSTEDRWDRRDSYGFFKMGWKRDGYRYPPQPHAGPHELLQDKEGDTRLYFKYNPNDDIWTEDGYHPRKNKVSFGYSFSDNEIVDVDAFSHRDMDYLNSVFYDRRQRKHYLRYMDILQELMRFKKQEIEQEKPFAQLLQSQCNITELEAMDEIHWWKTKNKIKRSLTADDTKALRMIKKKLKS